MITIAHPEHSSGKLKTGFQDGSYGGHFRFPICMILAIFHIHVNLLLHCKFHFNSPCGLSKTEFQDGGCGGHLGCPIGKILAHFNPEVVLLLQSKFQLKLTKGLGFCLFYSGFTSLSTIFQSYLDGVWMWKGAKYSLLESCLTDISCQRHLT